jgi:hypothetical protein
VTTTAAGGGLPFTGAASLPMLFGALALLGLGGTSLLAGSRRRRRAEPSKGLRASDGRTRKGGVPPAALAGR